MAPLQFSEKDHFYDMPSKRKSDWYIFKVVKPGVGKGLADQTGMLLIPGNYEKIIDYDNGISTIQDKGKKRKVGPDGKELHLDLYGNYSAKLKI